MNTVKLQSTCQQKKKIIAFLYTHNELTKREFKYLVVNLTKEVKDLCTENYKMLKKLKTQKNGKNFYMNGMDESILFNVHIT